MREIKSMYRAEQTVVAKEYDILSFPGKPLSD